MRRGFKYDTALCVNCKACNAACTLENGFQPGTRALYVWNENVVPMFGTVNLSLACNHCTNPVCLTGCPARAYSRNENGEVIHDPEKCMGCGYCTWRCPYNAPKVNKAKGFIEKCNFCFERSLEGLEPACVTACPTGAVQIEYDREYSGQNIPWFPETGIGPAVSICDISNNRKPVISPPEEDYILETRAEPENRIIKEWSLISFSILIIASAILIISSFFSDTTRFNGLSVILLMMGMIVSSFHLGVRKNFLRAPLNLLHSPLSREIISISLLTMLCAVNYIGPSVIPPLILPVFALLTLITVDMVYFSADRKWLLRLHSGQAFFSGLFIASYFAESVNAFIVFTLLAAGSLALRYKSIPRNSLARNLFYFRALSLPLALLLINYNAAWSYIATTVLLIAGAVADRLLFYFDFKPENIKEKITEHFQTQYEKERHKQPQDSHLP